VMFDFDHSRDRDTRWVFCCSRGVWVWGFKNGRLQGSPCKQGNRVGAPLAVPLAKRGEPKGGGISEPRNTHRAGKVHKLLRVQNPPTPCPLLIRVQRFGKESLRQGRFFPAHARGQARSFALTPCVPLSRRRERGNALQRASRTRRLRRQYLSRRRERGNALQGAPPCAPTPLSHAVGEGSGVRAKKRAHPAHDDLRDAPLSALETHPCRGERQATAAASLPCHTPLQLSTHPCRRAIVEPQKRYLHNLHAPLP
jgi:hypothetical protein